MPNSHVPEPPTGWLGAAMLAVGGIFGIIGTWIGSYLRRRTDLQVKQIDHAEAYTDDLREDMATNKALIQTLQAEWFSSKTETIELKSEISHLRNEIEKLQNTVLKYQEDLTQRDTVVAQLRQELADKETVIAALRLQIIDQAVIGVGEKEPPKRLRPGGA